MSSSSKHRAEAGAAKKRKLSFDEQLTAVDKKLKTESSSGHSSASKSSSQESSSKTGAAPRVKSSHASKSLAAHTPSIKHKLPNSTDPDTPSQAKKVKMEPDELDIEKYLYPIRTVPVSMRIGNIITTDLDYRLRNHSLPTPGLKYGALLHIEKDPNGGGTVVHCYADELAKLSTSQMEEFVQEYFQVVFAEDACGVGVHCMGIVHSSATYLPDLLEHFAHHYPDMTIKCSVLGKSDIDSCSIADYKTNVRKTYSAGTFRHGGMLSVSDT